MPSSPSSNSRNKHLTRILVLLCRLGVGAVFLISGWAKAIDPYGFIYKVLEYLAVWNIEVPREVVLAGCVALSTFEFVTGACIITGCLRRVAVWCAAALMLFMLPLTLYIAMLDPVADCGCFGDLFILSNWNTFFKNVIISAAVIYLALKNKALPCSFPPAIQWIAITVFTAYPLFISFIGYQVQPLVDFRAYPVGSQIFMPRGDEGHEEFIYSRGSEVWAFGLDELPDSTWTFVDVQTVTEAEDIPVISILDMDEEDVTDMVVRTDAEQLWLIVTEPQVQFLSGSHFIRQLSEYCQRNDIEMNAVISGAEGARNWQRMMHPSFPVYSAEDTALKSLVRGTAAVVFTSDGIIQWKRTLNSMDDTMIEVQGSLEEIQPTEDGRILGFVTLVALGILGVLAFFGVIPRIVRQIISLFHKKTAA